MVAIPNLEKDRKDIPLARLGALYSIQAIIGELARVRCDACSGFGHASSSCPTYARFVEFGAGNKEFQKLFRSALEVVGSTRKATAMNPMMMADE